MAYSALFLGSIGVVTETSELQRRAFNEAFARYGLGWDWDAHRYAAMLEIQGGQARIARYAETRGEVVDVRALYAAKQSIFAALTRAEGTPPRPGVTDILEAARHGGLKRAFVTSTSAAQVAATLAGTGGALKASTFDYVGDLGRVAAPKPAPDIYLDAMAALRVRAADVLCIEDTPESAAAAQAAGLRVVGFPGAAARGRAFPAGVAVVEFLSPSLLDLHPAGIAAA